MSMVLLDLGDSLLDGLVVPGRLRCPGAEGGHGVSVPDSARRCCRSNRGSAEVGRTDGEAQRVGRRIDFGCGGTEPVEGTLRPHDHRERITSGGAESEISPLRPRFPRDPDYLVESSVAGHPLMTRQELQRSGLIEIRAEFFQDLVVRREELTFGSGGVIASWARNPALEG